MPRPKKLNAHIRDPQEEAMRLTKRLRGLLACGTLWVALAAVAATSVAVAQIPRPPKVPNQNQVYLVRQDFSDCTNTNVPNVDSPLVGGNVWVTRMSDGTTAVKVAMTASPNMTYHFFLKCVRLISDITTDSEGVANVAFSFPTNAAGNVYAFDMYPEGAPAGNKFQSAQVAFQ
jgi:hypothetical protein